MLVNPYEYEVAIDMINGLRFHPHYAVDDVDDLPFGVNSFKIYTEAVLEVIGEDVFHRSDVEKMAHAIAVAMSRRQRRESYIINAALCLQGSEDADDEDERGRYKFFSCLVMYVVCIYTKGPRDITRGHLDNVIKFKNFGCPPENQYDAYLDEFDMRLMRLYHIVRGLEGVYQ